jgi:uncharacterized protein (TIGR04206 family)
MAYSTPRRRLLAVALLVAVPWTVISIGEEYTLVFAFGLFNTNPPQLVTLYDYLFRFTAGPTTLPEYLLAWPTSLLLYCGALASALGGVFGREDRRVTAGLLVFAGLSQVSVALGLSRITGRLAIPLGTGCLWLLAWWFYWPDLRETLPAAR